MVINITLDRCSQDAESMFSIKNLELFSTSPALVPGKMVRFPVRVHMASALHDRALTCICGCRSELCS